MSVRFLAEPRGDAVKDVLIISCQGGVNVSAKAVSRMADILIVEDDADTAETMARLLKLVGHKVRIAFNGLDAIEMARHESPKLVLLDIGLPGLDGYQVAARLRQELSESITVIAITGYGQEEHRRRALAAGVDHYFLKPVDHETLFDLLSRGQTDSLPAGPIARSADAASSGGHSAAVLRQGIEITNSLGLHLRAADQFVRLALQFQANVRVTCDGNAANGRSILDRNARRRLRFTS